MEERSNGYSNWLLIACNGTISRPYLRELFVISEGFVNLKYPYV